MVDILPVAVRTRTRFAQAMEGKDGHVIVLPLDRQRLVLRINLKTGRLGDIHFAAGSRAHEVSTPVRTGDGKIKKRRTPLGSDAELQSVTTRLLGERVRYCSWNG